MAIELTETARRAIAAEQDRLQHALAGAGPSSIKWTAFTHLHLTLVFLGRVENDRVDVVVETIRRPIEAEPFSIVFGGLGVFPPRGEPRVLWLGLMSGADRVKAVQSHVVHRVTALGLALEERAFTPHLTIARWREGRPSDRRRVLERERADDIVRVDVSSVTLFESRLSPTGSTYTALCHSPLAEPAAPPLQSS